jgi:SAM-dependent methyltransferase
MASVSENRTKWSHYRWELEGHEWSPGGHEAGTDLLWWRSIRPRVQSALPARALLEIAPGFGRWTSFLLGECDRLVGADVTGRCVDACRERFAQARHAEFWVNDGQSLPMIAPESIDFAFSFDSLVHVDAAQIRGYLRELARTLKPGGLGFFHHSNLGAYANDAEEVPAYIRRPHGRAASVSARTFRDACRDAGLVCLSQEVINWIGRGTRVDRHSLDGRLIPLTDCFSVFTRPGDAFAERPTRVYVNRRFVDEWRQVIVLSALYGRRRSAPAATPPNGIRPQQNDGEPRRCRAISLQRLASAARARVAAAAEPRTSRVREEAIGRWYAARDTIARRIASGSCPDCGRRLTPHCGTGLCQVCVATFVVA